MVLWYFCVTFPGSVAQKMPEEMICTELIKLPVNLMAEVYSCYCSIYTLEVIFGFHSEHAMFMHKAYIYA